MGVPDQLFTLGTESLNGRDGDTLRAAGEKYNAHVHQTVDVQAAIDAAGAPTAANPFATIADCGSGQTTDVQAALNGAASPSAVNPFATIDDCGSSQTTDVQAALDGAAAPNATNPFATVDDLPPEQTADIQAALSGAAAPSSSNVFATIADLSSAGGLTWAATSVTTGSLSSGGTVSDGSITMNNGSGLIFEIDITVPVGCIAASISLFSDSARTKEIFGTVPLGADLNSTLVRGFHNDSASPMLYYRITYTTGSAGAFTIALNGFI